jgi:hypothetical protein
MKEKAIELVELSLSLSLGNHQCQVTSHSLIQVLLLTNLLDIHLGEMELYSIR